MVVSVQPCSHSLSGKNTVLLTYNGSAWTAEASTDFDASSLDNDNKEFSENEYTVQQLKNNLKIRIAHKLIQNIDYVKHANSGGFQFSIEKTNKVH